MRLANRTKEVEFFREMLRGEVTQRILLVEAPSGFGKTDLLAKFGHNCSQRQLVQIDLKGASSGIIYLISRFQKKLGQNHFPHYEKAVREFLTAGVEIADNKIVGEENTLQVILQGVDETQRDFRYCFQLNAILEIDAWFQYAKDQGFTFSRDVVWTVVQLTKGQPVEIVKTLETLERSPRQ